MACRPRHSARASDFHAAVVGTQRARRVKVKRSRRYSGRPGARWRRASASVRALAGRDASCSIWTSVIAWNGLPSSRSVRSASSSLAASRSRSARHRRHHLRGDLQHSLRAAHPARSAGSSSAMARVDSFAAAPQIEDGARLVPQRPAAQAREEVELRLPVRVGPQVAAAERPLARKRRVLPLVAKFGGRRAVIGGRRRPAETGVWRRSTWQLGAIIAELYRESVSSQL